MTNIESNKQNARKGLDLLMRRAPLNMRRNSDWKWDARRYDLQFCIIMIVDKR